ncbi:hypothetical protein ABIA36_002829 [Leifsonia sp. EB34]
MGCVNSSRRERPLHSGRGHSALRWTRYFVIAAKKEAPFGVPTPVAVS